MIRILLFIILAVVVLSLLYFQIKAKDGKKTVIMIAAGLVIGAVGLMAQSIASTYLAVLTVLGLSLLVSLIYAKKIEESVQTRTDIMVHKKTVEKKQELDTFETKKQASPEPAVQKSQGMQKITKFKEEKEVEQ